MSYQKRRNLITHIILIIMSAIMVFPIVWWVFATFKPLHELGLENILPIEWTVDNYVKGWNMSDRYTFTDFFRNSLFIELISIIGSVLTSGLVAFGFARMNFKGRNFWFSILMMTLMLPSQVTVVSQFIIYNNVNLLDTYVPLILPYWFGGGAFFIFLVNQFIRGIPKDLDEAAKIDGAGVFQTYWRIIFPLIRTPLTTVGIFTFIWSWDDFYAQVLYIKSYTKFTVGLALRLFIDQFEIQWGQLLAMSLLSVIPAVILFFSAQKQFVAGIATSGLKG